MILTQELKSEIIRFIMLMVDELKNMLKAEVPNKCIILSFYNEPVFLILIVAGVFDNNIKIYSNCLLTELV